jgi:hypothetical protein
VRGTVVVRCFLLAPMVLVSLCGKPLAWGDIGHKVGSELNPRVDLPAPPQVAPGGRYVDETDG